MKKDGATMKDGGVYPWTYVDYAGKTEKDESSNEPHIHPFTCPVCMGKGIVPNGFYLSAHSKWYSSSLEPDKCRSCGGSGIIWR